MKPISLVLCCTVIATSSIACSQTAPTNSPMPTAAASPASVAPAKATPDELAAARGIFAKNCESCHGDKGEGGLVKVEDKKLKVPSFKAGHALKHSDEEFVKQITKGGDGMPAFKDKLKPEEMQELVNFIRKEFQGK
jgi:mono/diheme cytochrome c family protein